MVVSRYKWNPFTPHRRSAKLKFNKWLEENFKDFNRGFLISYDYYKSINFYVDLFGRENIGIFLMDELADPKGRFTEKLSIFLGIETGKSRELLKNKRENKAPAPEIWLKLFSLSLKKIRLQFEYRAKFKDIKINDYWRKKLIDLYKNNNKRLAQEFDLDLKRYDYPL